MWLSSRAHAELREVESVFAAVWAATPVNRGGTHARVVFARGSRPQPPGVVAPKRQALADANVSQFARDMRKLA